jgi:ATP-binding cassette subfamily B protein
MAGDDDAGTHGTEKARGRFREEAVASRTLSRDLGLPLERRVLPPMDPGLWKSARQRLGDLRPRRRGRSGKGLRVPVRLQSQVSDCGPACLSMVLAAHGVRASAQELREETGAGREGVSARRLLDAARRRGMSARGVRTSVAGLQNLQVGSILFWGFNHFVVLVRAERRFVEIIDPALGRRRLRLEAVGEAFTGVALEFDMPIGPHLRRPRVPRVMVPDHWKYLRLFWPKSRLWLVLALVSLLTLPLGLVVPVTTEYVVNHADAGRALHLNVAIFGAVIGLFAAYLSVQIVRTLAVVAMQAFGEKIATIGMLQRLVRLPSEFFLTRTPGDLALRVRTGAGLRQTLAGSTLSVMADGIMIVVYMALIFVASVRLSMIVLGFGVVEVSIVLLAWRRQHSLTCDLLEKQAASQAGLAELLEGMTTLKSAGLENVASERWSHVLVDEVNSRARSSRSLAIWSVLSTAFQFMAPVAVLVLGASWAGSTVSIGKVVGFSALTLELFAPLTTLVQGALQVAGLGSSLARIGDIVEGRVETEGGIIGELTAGRVEMNEVGFCYTQEGRFATQDISVTFPEGSFTVILGASGSGKSTVAALLAGLYVPTHGEISIDGMTTSTLDRQSLRKSIGYVNQDARLFSGTIFENISTGIPDPDMDAVKSASMLAELHRDVRNFPMGYETLLASGGVGLSGGQRQRVALARALIRKPRLIILDEATNAVDPDTERRVFENIIGLGSTLVVVAHRLSSIEKADQVLLMSKGRLVRIGTVDDFRANPPADHRALIEGIVG